MLQQPAGAGAPPVVKAPLHEQHLLHRRAESPRERSVLPLLSDHLVAGVQKGFDFTAAVFRPNPFGDLKDGEPQQHRVKEHRRDRFLRLHPLIGVFQARLHKPENCAVLVGLERAVRVGKEVPEQAELPQAFEAGGGVPRMEQLEGFVVEPRLRDLVQQFRQFPDGPRSAPGDAEVQFRRQPRRPEHADRVLAIARYGIADQPQGAAGDIVHPAGVIPDAEVGDVVVERVDREIPAPNILVDGPVDVVAENPAAVSVLAVVLGAAPGRPKGDHLDHFPAEPDMRQPETPPDQATIAKQRAHLLGPRIGNHVVILRTEAEQQVAHAAADDKRLAPAALEPVQDLERVAGNIRPAERMLRPADDHRAGKDLIFRSVQSSFGVNPHRLPNARQGDRSKRLERTGSFRAGQVSPFPKDRYHNSPQFTEHGAPFV